MYYQSTLSLKIIIIINKNKKIKPPNSTEINENPLSIYIELTK